jgi:hypothetical protein
MNGDKEKAARLWDELVKRGVPENEATAKVEAIWGRPEDMVEAPEQPPEVGMARGLLLKGTQGALMGAGDEIGAAIRSIPYMVPGGESPLQAFKDALESSRGAQAAFSRQHPFLAGAADIGGTIGSAVATGGSALLARPMVGGAVLGGVEAFNRAEGNPLQRLPEAGVGTVFGGLMGGVANKAMEVASPVVRPVAGAIRDALVKRLPARARARLGTGAASGFAQERATEKLGKALEREGMTGADVARLSTTATPEQTILDVVSERGPIQRLGRAVEAVPSKGSTQLTESLANRTAAAPTRIKTALQGKTGLTFEDAVATVDDLVAMRKLSAKHLYDKAYEKTVPLSTFGAELSSKSFRKAWARGVEIAADEGVVIPPVNMLATLTDGVPVQAVDYMKRGMDDVIQGAWNRGGMGTNQARVLRTKLKGMLARVDDAVPEYKIARAQFEGDTEVLDAFKRGRESFLKEDPRLVSRDLGTMSPSVAEFYKRGALDAVRERIEKSADGRDLTKLLTGNSEMRTRIRALFNSDADYDAFVQEMIRERRMYQTAQFSGGQGSRTTPTAEDVSDLRVPAPNLAHAMLLPKWYLARALDTGLGRRLRNVDEAVVDRISPLLTKPLAKGGGFDLQKALERYKQQAAERAARRGIVSRTVAGTTGALVGSSTNRR